VAFAIPRDSIDHAGYADTVIEELGARVASLPPRTLTSVFFGGGTPSLWKPEELGRVLGRIVDAFAADRTTLEVSVECDPTSIDGEVARALLDAGVNRLSIGVQALDDERLRFLGRIHTKNEAIEAIEAAVGAGVPRVSTDLMYAVAGQAPEVAAREARQLVELGATHVSAYGLTIEADTPFGQLARRGKLPLCDDAVMAAAFFAIDDALTEAGLEHYEVSNYAAPGQFARHNLGYWRGRDYLGLGCGAFGTIAAAGGVARRYRNQPNPRAYLALLRQLPKTGEVALGRVGEGVDALAAFEELLDPATRLRERIMLGLRLKEGLDLEAAALDLCTDPYPGDRKKALERMEARGRIVRDGPRISVPRDAWIWVDDTAVSPF
jgi:putative oxygen-independent coproporphyrinogen III oxidase